MSNTHYATFQFSYDHVAPEDFKSSQLSARQPTRPNPREFLKSATLPALRRSKDTPVGPDPGRKAHRNHLQSHYDPLRVLQSILRLKQTLFHLNVIEYYEAAPTRAAPGPPPITAAHLTSNTVTNLSDISDWVYANGLLPMQQTLHQTSPSTENYRWISTDNGDDGDLDAKLVRMYHWNTSDKVEVEGEWETPDPSMIVFVQEPWVLGEKDFTNFVRTKSIPQIPRQLTGKERLWAKIYDECTTNKCHWFVVTTYNQWTFGVFSEGFQAAFVTLDIPSPQPYVPYVTPLQTLYYWLCSSMKFLNSFVPTEMMESIQYLPIIERTQQYLDSDTNAGEWQPAPVFQHSDSEPSSESDEDVKSTYSRFSHRSESELSFQPNTNRSPTAEGFRNTYLTTNGVLKLRLAGDQLTKEAVLPRRHWQSDEKADTIEIARAQLMQNHARNDTLDWLDERGWDSWENGGSFPALRSDSVDEITSTIRTTNIRDAWVTTADGEPPSPTLSNVSQDGSMVATRGAVGKAMFAVAPKHPRRQFSYQV